MKYRKKPVEIEAIKWTGNNENEIFAFCPDAYFDVDMSTGHIELFIKTLEGKHMASEGDYIIQGVKGEFYPCKPDIFEMTHEEVNRDG